MCHRAADQPEPGEGPNEQVEWGRTEGSKLGRLLRIRVSAKQRAWVHEQCAWWSPEVNRKFELISCYQHKM